MNKRNIKKVVLISAAIICLALTINAGRFMIAEGISKDIDFGEFNNPANSYDRAQGNHVLYTEGNGVETAPFFWGDRLYLYSIENDRSVLIKTQKSPFSYGFSNAMFVYKDTILFNQFFMNDYLAMESVNLKDSSGYKYKSSLDGIDNVSIKNDNIFGIDVVIGGEMYEGISKFNLKTGNVDIIQGEVDTDTFLRIVKDTIYYYSYKDESYVGKSLVNGTIERLPFGAPVGENLNHKLIFVDSESGKVMIKDNNKYENVATFELEGERLEHTPVNFWDGDVYECRNDDLYFYGGGYKVVKANLTTGENETVINMKTKAWELRNVFVSFCSDYIVIDASYISGNKEKQQLLIYDYEGQLLRTKDVRPSHN